MHALAGDGFELVVQHGGREEAGPGQRRGVAHADGGGHREDVMAALQRLVAARADGVVQRDERDCTVARLEPARRRAGLDDDAGGGEAEAEGRGRRERSDDGGRRRGTCLPGWTPLAGGDLNI